MLPCILKIGANFSHLVLWGHFLLRLFLMVLGMCCLPHYHNIRIFLLCAQLSSLTPFIMLVTCQLVSFFGHLHHMSFLVLDMADAVEFLLFYYLIGAGIILHILELICLHIFWCNPIQYLYQIIIYPPNLL